jgi:hypothetical protein
MNEKQLTGVEWLIQKLINKQNGVFDGFPYLSVDEIYDKAKGMEKEQTKSRAVESYYLYTQYLEQIPKVGGATVEMDFEQWYEQTYGGDK